MKRLNALGGEAIPDPTTAGDFSRRLGKGNVLALQESFHKASIKAWRQQPESSFVQAIIVNDLVEKCVL